MTSIMPGCCHSRAVEPVGLVDADRGADLRRVAARVQHVAAGIVERHGQAERLAFLDLGDALLDLGGGQLVHAAELVVRARSRPRSSSRAAASSASALPSAPPTPPLPAMVATGAGACHRNVGG